MQHLFPMDKYMGGARRPQLASQSSTRRRPTCILITHSEDTKKQHLQHLRIPLVATRYSVFGQQTPNGGHEHPVSF
jgi:hypothetical protein